MGDFFSALSWIPSWWDILLVVSYVFVVLSVPSVLIEREGLPYAALAWILAMFAMPVVGLFFWWAFGRKHLARKRRRRRKASAHVWKSLAEEVRILAGVSFASLAETGLVLNSADFANLNFPEGETLHFKPAPKPAVATA